MFEGTVREDKAAGIVGESDCAKDFADFLKKSLEAGITARRDIHDEENEAFVTVEGPVTPADPNFALDFRDYLEREGYEARKECPELSEELKLLLSGFPESESRAKLLNAFPDMTYLEQTFVLEALKAEKEKGGV